jgi:D-alanine-D-alanine ligase
VFVPVLHGTFGEDGAIQGLLELRAAYVGCGVGMRPSG